MDRVREEQAALQPAHLVAVAEQCPEPEFAGQAELLEGVGAVADADDQSAAGSVAGLEVGGRVAAHADAREPLVYHRAEGLDNADHLQWRAWSFLELWRYGGEEADIRKNLDLEEWKRMDRYDALIGRNINKVWLEVEEANF